MALVLIQVPLQYAIGQEHPPGCRDFYQNELRLNPKRSLSHFQAGECFFERGRKDWVNAANEFHEALNGDLQPSWIKVWSHINLGKIFDATGQRERALNEYRLAEQTKDNTRNAQDEVAKYRQSAYEDEELRRYRQERPH